MIISDVDKKGQVIDSDSMASTDIAMTSAILSGLTHPDDLVTQQTKYNCPSGNCTWDIFQSLAVCSACIDLTDRLSRVIVPYLTSYGDPINMTVYQLPNGLSLTSVFEEDSPHTWMTGFGTSNHSQSISFGATETFIWSMTLIRVLNSETSRSNFSVIAAECGLWYCINTYSSVVKDGNLIETSSPAPSRRSGNSWQWSAAGNELTESHGNVPVLNTLSFGKKSSSVYLTDLQLGDGFNVSQTAVYGISSLMDTTFTSDQAWVPLRRGCERDMAKRLFPGNIINAYAISIEHPLYTTEAMKILHHSYDLNATFATFATSMTNSIRENSDDNLVMIGKAGTLHAVYQIHWEFLILPFALVFVNVGFFVIVIYHTHKSDLAILCSGTLPTINFGGNIGPVFNKIKMRSRMEKMAKFQQARFVSSSTEDVNSDDVEAVTVPREDDATTPSHQNDDVSSFHETAGYEIEFMGERLANQESETRNNEERSIRSTISFEPEGARSNSIRSTIQEHNDLA